MREIDYDLRWECSKFAQRDNEENQNDTEKYNKLSLEKKLKNK